jgi:methylmalonyl-CoA mutase cobalamin-binding subunit
MAQEAEVPIEGKESALGSRPEDFRSAALNAAGRLDGPELQAVLERATVILGVPGFLDNVAGPVLQEIGHGWSAGTLSVGHEHLATSVFRRVLGWIIGVFEVNGTSPRVLVATPPGQAHELGALMAAASAATEGWDVIYLGADLPVEEILAASRQAAPRAVALSIVLPVDDQRVIENLQQIRRGLDPEVQLFLGGAAVAQQPDKFSAVGGRIITSLPEFRATLRDVQEQQ